MSNYQYQHQPGKDCFDIRHTARLETVDSRMVGKLIR